MHVCRFSIHADYITVKSHGPATDIKMKVVVLKRECSVPSYPLFPVLVLQFPKNSLSLLANLLYDVISKTVKGIHKTDCRRSNLSYGIRYFVKTILSSAGCNKLLMGLPNSILRSEHFNNRSIGL